MARIVGVDIPRNKKIAFSLCYIHGIGMSTALEICKSAKVNTEKRVQELSEKQITSIREIISSLEINVEGEVSIATSDLNDTTDESKDGEVVQIKNPCAFTGFDEVVDYGGLQNSISIYFYSIRGRVTPDVTLSSIAVI